MVESLERRKDSMIAALWSNDGLNDNKGTRQNAIQEIEANFDEAVRQIHGNAEEEVEIDKSNPFFSAMEKGMAKLHGQIEVEADEETAKQMTDQEDEFSKYIDQP